MSRYHYQSLKTSTSIRLLSILPQQHDGDIALSVKDTTLAEAAAIRYKAISYTWGRDPASKKIWIDGSWMLLRPNLWRFLNHTFSTAYDLYDPPLYWIDAISINQDDLTEKASQVSMMGQIFSTAQAVYIWLDDTSKQKVLASKFRERCTEWREQGLDWAKPEWELVAWDIFTSEYREGDVLDLDVLDEIQTIANHDYWQRLWTFQEVLLGRQTYIILADTVVDIESFHALRKVAIAQAYGSFPQPEEFALQPQWSSLNHFLNFLGASRQYQYSPNERNWRLDWLLSISSVRKCSDIRDKVYGLVGICNTLKGFKVDYGCSVEDLLVRTFEKMKDDALRPTRANPQSVCKIGLDDLCGALGVEPLRLAMLTGLEDLKIQVLPGEYEDDILRAYDYIFLLDGRRWMDSGSFHVEKSNRSTGNMLS